MVDKVGQCYVIVVYGDFVCFEVVGMDVFGDDVDVREGEVCVEWFQGVYLFEGQCFWCFGLVFVVNDDRDFDGGLVICICAHVQVEEG